MLGTTAYDGACACGGLIMGFAPGDRVTDGRSHGTLRYFVEPRPGWHRALVLWDLEPGEATAYEQFVDLAQLSHVAQLSLL